MDITPTSQAAVQLASQPVAAPANRQAPSVQAVTGASPSSDTLQTVPGQQTSTEAVTQAARAVESFIKQAARTLEFSIDQDTKMTVVKLVDSETKQVIRQVPTNEVLEIAKALDKFQGLFVERKV